MTVSTTGYLLGLLDLHTASKWFWFSHHRGAVLWNSVSYEAKVTFLSLRNHINITIYNIIYSNVDMTT